jgi:protease I
LQDYKLFVFAKIQTIGFRPLVSVPYPLYKEMLMATIAVLIDDLFEDVEYSEPAHAFTQAGHSLVHVGLAPGKIVHGKKEQTPVSIEKAASEITPADFDALLLPGGYSPDKLRAHDEPVAFVCNFVETGKPIFAICHGPQLLLSARGLEGRRVTGWKSIAQDLRYAGADYVDREVVEDGNLVTSRQPSDIPAFIAACLKRLA